MIFSHSYVFLWGCGSWSTLNPYSKNTSGSEVFRHSNSTEVAGVHEVIINRIRASIFRVRSVFPEAVLSFVLSIPPSPQGTFQKSSTWLLVWMIHDNIAMTFHLFSLSINEWSSFKLVFAVIWLVGPLETVLWIFGKHTLQREYTNRSLERLKWTSFPPWEDFPFVWDS